MQKLLSKWEQINQSKDIFVCFDADHNISFITDNLHKAKQYCKWYDLNFSQYPIKCYCED